MSVRARDVLFFFFQLFQQFNAIKTNFNFFSDFFCSARFNPFIKIWLRNSKKKKKNIVLFSFYACTLFLYLSLRHFFHQEGYIQRESTRTYTHSVHIVWRKNTLNKKKITLSAINHGPLIKFARS